MVALLFLTVDICSALEFKTDNYTIVTEPIASPGSALVSITSNASGTLIQIDKEIVGSSPWNGKLAAGNHIINLIAPDHYDLQFLLTCQENTKYSISCNLDPHTGFIDVTIRPEDATLYLDGAKMVNQFAEVPVGYHIITTEKFGFEKKTVKILVLKGKISRVSIMLEPSLFSIRDFRLTRKVFNPVNRGLFGKTTLTFSVTAPGYGRVEIRDSSGSLIFQHTLHPFTTWAQSFSWNGKTELGSAKDGIYTARLLLWPEKNQELSVASEAPSEQASIVKEISFRIDRCQVIVPAGYANARTGLAFVSSPSIQELPIFGLDIGSVIAYDNASSLSAGVGLSGGIRLGSRTALGFADFFLENGDTGLSASLNRALLKHPRLDVAIAARYEFSNFSNSGRTILNDIELNFPLALKTGPLRFGLEPGIRLNLDDGSIAAQTGAGLWYQAPSLFAGFSAHQVFANGGIASDTNPLSLALEAKYMLNGLPLTMGMRLSVVMTPELENLHAWFGIGLAF